MFPELSGKKAPWDPAPKIENAFGMRIPGATFYSPVSLPLEIVLISCMAGGFETAVRHRIAQRLSLKYSTDRLGKTTENA
jgi:hypothetical protein